MPKKILVGAAEAVHAARDMADRGVPAGALAIDWPSLMRFKRSLIDPTTPRTEQAWATLGVEQFHGRARFVGPTTLAVGDDRLTGRRILIAAGAMPIPLSFPGAARLTVPPGPQRRQLLGAGGQLPGKALRSAVHPRHLPNLSGEGIGRAQEDSAATHATPLTRLYRAGRVG